MGYLDVLSRRGLLTTLRHSKYLWFEPEELVTDDILQIARDHKDEIVQEVMASAAQHDENASEITPDYRFLWVATTLESFEECDPRYGYEMGGDPVYRMLDAPYYAWLRHCMENAKNSHAAGHTADQTFEILRDRFNAVHNWAITHIGEDALRQAIRTTNTKRYIAPCDATLDAYHQTWAEARRANQKCREHARSAQVARLGHLLSTQGYAGIKSPIVDDVIVFARDDGVALPTKWADKVRFTMDELILMIGSSVEEAKQIYDVKQIFGGKVVTHGGGQPRVVGGTVGGQSRVVTPAIPVTQGSMF